MKSLVISFDLFPTGFFCLFLLVCWCSFREICYMYSKYFLLVVCSLYLGYYLGYLC